LTFEDDLKRIEPFIGHEKAIRMWRAYQCEDGIGRREMEASLQLYLERELGVNPISPAQGLSIPLNHEADGDFKMGSVVVGDRELYPFGLREDEFIQHMAIFGRSGAGKTNTVALLIHELVRHRKPFMIFDWKRNYRDLLTPPNSVPLEVYTVGRPVHPLRFNPLIPPPGTDIKIWLKKLIEIVSHAYYLGEGVVFLLLEALDHIYETFGCYHDPANATYPCMTDVLKHLQETRVTGRKAMWMDSTLRAVQSLCFGQISDVINVSRNDSILDLLNKNVCLELNSLGQSEKIFFIETLLVWIHHCRMLETERETFKHCIIIEEAHNILTVSAKETVVDTLMREIRELGEAIVLVDQHPSQISVPALGNTYCTIGLNAKHSKDIHVLGEIMQIAREQREVMGLLPMGHAVVKLQSRFIRPFQIRLPKVSLDKGSVTDSHLMQLYPPDFSDSEPESPESPLPGATGPIPAAHKVMTESGSTGLSSVEEQLLLDMRDHPLDGVVRRYSRLGISRRRGNHAKERLIGKNVIEPVDVPTKTGKIVLLDFTVAMKEALKRNHIELPGRRTGGLVHSYWKTMLAAAFKTDGWEVTEECPIGAGKAVDVEARRKTGAVAIEVETGDRGLENITKVLDHGYDWIISFSVDKDVELRTKRAMKRTGLSLNHVLFMGPADYEDKIGFLTRKSDQPAEKRNL
jgi:hypothetical protein